MIKIVGAVVLGVLSANVYGVACETNPNKMGAHYMLEKKLHKQAGSEALTSTSRLALWRRGKEVAHELEDQQVTEVWNLLPNGRVRPVRYFDEYRRGIEYQPNEVEGSTDEKIWAKKTRLITKISKNTMKLLRSQGDGCDKLDYYSAQRKGVHYLLTWSPSKELPVRYKEVTQHYSFTATLTLYEPDESKVDSFFTDRDSYQTTDYADIGDNESDPFLLKMINLGFVSHGASGFYNANGDALESASPHHRH